MAGARQQGQASAACTCAASGTSPQQASEGVGRRGGAARGPRQGRTWRETDIQGAGAAGGYQAARLARPAHQHHAGCPGGGITQGVAGPAGQALGPRAGAWAHWGFSSAGARKPTPRPLPLGRSSPACSRCMRRSRDGGLPLASHHAHAAERVGAVSNQHIVPVDPWAGEGVAALRRQGELVLEGGVGGRGGECHPDAVCALSRGCRCSHRGGSACVWEQAPQRWSGVGRGGPLAQPARLAAAQRLQPAPLPPTSAGVGVV